MIPDKHAKLMKIFCGCKCSKQPSNLCALQSLFSCLWNICLDQKIFAFRVFIIKFYQLSNFLGWVTLRRFECTATCSHSFITRILKSRWGRSIEMQKICLWVWIQNVYSRKLWVDFHCEIFVSRNSKPIILYWYSEYGPGCIIWDNNWDCRWIPFRNICINCLSFSNLSIDFNCIFKQWIFGSITGRRN